MSDPRNFNGFSGHNGGPPLYEDSGWVAISRASRTHPVVGWHLFVDPVDPSRGALQPALAWYDLIMECRYMDGTVNNNGRIMPLRRGETLGANAWLASRWNWSVKTVRTFLKKLEEHGMITRHGAEDGASEAQNAESSLNPPRDSIASKQGRSSGKSKGRFANIISVCNYDVYQMSGRSQGQVKRHVEGPLKGRLGAGYGQVEGRLENDLHIIARDTAHAHARPNKDNKGTREQEPTLELRSPELPLSEPAGSDGAAKSKRHEYPADYEDFWREYPDTRGMSKFDAYRAWKDLKPAERVAAKASLPVWKSFLADQRKGNRAYITLHAQGFLNQKRFESLQPSADAGSDGRPWFTDPAKVATITEDQWRNSIIRHANGTWPVGKLGPVPGTRYCVVPPALIAEFRLTEKYDERGIKIGGE